MGIFEKFRQVTTGLQKGCAACNLGTCGITGGIFAKAYVLRTVLNRHKECYVKDQDALEYAWFHGDSNTALKQGLTNDLYEQIGFGKLQIDPSTFADADAENEAFNVE